ncbi:MAG: polysaccharide deacetylase family protein [Myxococcota bacterium]
MLRWTVVALWTLAFLAFIGSSSAALFASRDVRPAPLAKVRVEAPVPVEAAPEVPLDHDTAEASVDETVAPSPPPKPELRPEDVLRQGPAARRAARRALRERLRAQTEPPPRSTVPRAVVRRALARDMRNGMILRGRTRHRLLHFTFDDGPRVDTTPYLLAHLDNAGVRATFFLVARQMDSDRGRRAKQSELARQMMLAGHTIGLHGFDHSRLTELSDVEIRAQLSESEVVFERELGGRPWLFRPPYGHHDEKSDEIVSSERYTQMMWTITAERRRTRTAEAVVEAFADSLDRRERSRFHGGLVILHDRHRWVADAFPDMIAEIDRRNCELYAEGEELWDIVNDPRLFFVPRGEANPSEYAPELRLSDEAIEARQAPLRARASRNCS